MRSHAEIVEEALRLIGHCDDSILCVVGPLSSEVINHYRDNGWIVSEIHPDCLSIYLKASTVHAFTRSESIDLKNTEEFDYIVRVQ